MRGKIEACWHLAPEDQQDNGWRTATGQAHDKRRQSHAPTPWSGREESAPEHGEGQHTEDAEHDPVTGTYGFDFVCRSQAPLHFQACDPRDAVGRHEKAERGVEAHEYPECHYDSGCSLSLEGGRRWQGQRLHARLCMALPPSNKRIHFSREVWCPGQPPPKRPACRTPRSSQARCHSGRCRVVRPRAGR